ncbi:MAG TPA: S8 family serine peptidase [Candidatus Limnocylindria bacterium]|nr:S8 family serine peptidase [Candidatus Limnocylindria bacterium]
MPRPRHHRLRLVSLLAAAVMLASSFVAPVPVAGTPNKVRLVVAFQPGTSPARAEQLAAAGGGTIVERIDQLNVRVVEVSAVAVAHARGWWARSSEVAAVEADGLVEIDWLPPDPLWSSQVEQRLVRAPQAWDLERGVYTTVVAVVDTGVQLSHPDLRDRLVSGWDFVNRDNRPGDDHGHGTSVSGIVAATSNSIGITGICPRCRLMPIKALGANGTGWWSVAAQGIIWAADHKADVINLSFGGPTGGSILQNAINYARSKGAVVVGAAGNSGVSTPFYPAAMAGVVSVAAADTRDLRFSWSNYSTTWVDLAAPGCTFATVRGGSYNGFCGTSAATPIVSGIAALVESARPALTGTQIESILFGSTARTPFAYTRLGRIDAYKAVYRAVHHTTPSTTNFTASPPLLNPLAQVTFLPGDHAGYRFDGYGAIVRGAGASLAAASVGLTSKRSTIPGRTGFFYYMVGGTLDGWWVAESDDVFLTPEPTPTPSPSTESSPTSSPTPGP